MKPDKLAITMPELIAIEKALIAIKKASIAVTSLQKSPSISPLKQE
jgi:hypothetical protein